MLYVLLAVDSPTSDASQAAPGQRSVNAKGLLHDAATHVSCGPEAWHFCMWLSAKMGDLTSRLGLTVCPIILPWQTSQCSLARGGVAEASANCTDWVLRARAAVVRHFVLTCPESFWWTSNDEASVRRAVPLVVDTCCAFTSRDVCSRWPRHWHLIPPHAASSEPKLKCALTSKGQGTASSFDGVSASVKSGPNEFGEESPSRASAPFKYTIVAGTFDRLHAGHRLLLAAAILAADETVGLGVSAGPLVEKKSAPGGKGTAELESFAHRLLTATAFLQLTAAARCSEVCISGFEEAIQEEACSSAGGVTPQGATIEGLLTTRANLKRLLLQRPPPGVPQCSAASLKLRVFRLSDALGPADRVSFDCLVVSAETIKGAEAVNNARMKRGKLPVSILAVEIVPKDMQTSLCVATALENTLPFKSNRSPDRPDSNVSPCESVCQQASAAPGKRPEIAREAEDAADAVHSSSQPQALKCSEVPSEACREKLSSTELRRRQWRWLGCDSLSLLCARFQAAWLWLVGAHSELEWGVRQSGIAFWRVLCAEHAAPWRRLHTFERVLRTVKRLDNEMLGANAEPVVLCIFLGSLLACPCRSIQPTTGASNECGLLPESSTLATWSTENEEGAWKKSAKRLLADIQSVATEAVSAESTSNSLRAHQERQGPLKACDGNASGSLSLKDCYSLLMGLLCEQRAASLATLTTFSPLHDRNEKRSLPDMSTSAASATVNTAESVRIVRRLAQLECTDDNEKPATQLRKLREEYFFVEQPSFNSCRTMQLLHTLENAHSFDCLEHQERLCAIATVKQQLEIIGHPTPGKG